MKWRIDFCEAYILRLYQKDLNFFCKNVDPKHGPTQNLRFSDQFLLLLYLFYSKMEKGA
jgi:hypothetical protein